MQRNKISFKGQKIFIGIDVHKKNWSVTALTEAGYKRTYSQNASARELFDFLDRHFPDGDYLAVYEAGFTGFSTYHDLVSLGIGCMVIHAADVPTTQYESVMKTDRIDSEKLAASLRAGLLKGIYVRQVDSLDDRGVVRARKSVQKDLTRVKQRIRSLLFAHGVEIPECHLDDKGQVKWTRAFKRWLGEDAALMSATRTSLDVHVNTLGLMEEALLEANRRVRVLCRRDRYKKNYELLRSIPGLGHIVSITLLTEIQDFGRFRNEKQFASYLGLVPTCHSSGDKTAHGEKTFRGNKALGPALIEAAWTAIRHDVGLSAFYADCCKRMKPNKAIVRVARKLANIILSVVKNQKKYEPYESGKPEG